MKKFISGFIIGGLLFGGISAYATNSQFIEVFYNVKQIKINKIIRNPDEKPFIYNGTTYVPLRFVADALGQKVSWEAETQTVNIGETEKDNEVYLGRDIKSIKEDVTFDDLGGSSEIVYDYDKGYNDNYNNPRFGLMGIAFKNPAHGLGSRIKPSATIEFATNGQYHKLNTTVGLLAGSKNTKATITIRILLDGKEVINHIIKAGTEPKQINLDISNVLKITFITESDAAGDVDIGWYDAYLTK